MTTPARQMHLSVLALAAGNNIAAWRMEDAQAGSMNLPLLKHMVQTAERGKFDFFFIADTPHTAPNVHPSWVVRLEPLTLLSVLSAITTHIGLAATVSTTYTEPYNLARYMASLDHLSGGRAAWNVVGGAFPQAAANFGRLPHPAHGERYARAREFLDVTKGLWDSWEEGALVMDKATGKYIDAAKMHTLNHEGKHFSVKGPLNILRPPQGYPVIVQAGASDEGRDFAAATSEAIFCVVANIEEGKAFRDDIRARAKQHGRNPDHLKVLPGIFVIIGQTEAEARAKLAALGEIIEADTAMKVLTDYLGQDLSQHPLDAPVPDLPATEMMQGYAVALLEIAREKEMTLRELRDLVAATQGHVLFMGTPEQIADDLEEWFLAGAADGFQLMPHYFPAPFDEFVDLVVPILQERGLFRKDYTGTTLREHMGLPFPEHPAKKSA